jgi:hypothetical protein
MGGPLADDEFNVILGALDMTTKTAARNMTREARGAHLGCFWEGWGRPGRESSWGP